MRHEQMVREALRVIKLECPDELLEGIDTAGVYQNEPDGHPRSHSHCVRIRSKDGWQSTAEFMYDESEPTFDLAVERTRHALRDLVWSREEKKIGSDPTDEQLEALEKLLAPLS